MHGSLLSLCTWGQSGPGRTPARRLGSSLLRFVAVQVFEGFEFLDEGFVLVLQHSHAVLQTLDVLLLLPATFPRRLSVGRRRHRLVFPIHIRGGGGGEARGEGGGEGGWGTSMNAASFIYHHPVVCVFIPVLHEADFPFAGHLHGGALGGQGWGGGHDHPRGEGASGGRSDLVSLDVTGGG